MSFPDDCIRGIVNPDCLVRVEGGLVADSNLFCFHGSSDQTDGWINESINWNDNDDVVGFTLGQKNADGTPQFTAGIAIIPLSELDRIKKRFPRGGYFDYERAPIEANPYHGNLRLRENIEKRLKKTVRAALALAAEIRPREDVEYTQQ